MTLSLCCRRDLHDMAQARQISSEERLHAYINTLPRNDNPENILNKTPDDGEGLIIDVWAGNLREEMHKIMDMIDDYPFIAMV